MGTGRQHRHLALHLPTRICLGHRAQLRLYKGREMLLTHHEHRTPHAREEAEHRVENFPQPAYTRTEGGMDTAHHYARRKTSQGAVDECALRQVARPVAEAYMADELRLLSVAAQLLLEEQSRRENPLCGLRQQLPHQVLSGERTAGRQL